MLNETDTDDDEVVPVENIQGPDFQSSRSFENCPNQKKIVKNLQDEREDSRMVGFASDDEKSPGLAEEEGRSQHINVDMVVVDSKCGLSTT